MDAREVVTIAQHLFLSVQQWQRQDKMAKRNPCRKNIPAQVVYTVQFFFMIYLLKRFGKCYPDELDAIFHKEFDGTTYFVMYYRYIKKLKWKEIPDKDGVHKSLDRIKQLHKRALEKFLP